jgi:hypothetical protein
VVRSAITSDPNATVAPTAPLLLFATTEDTLFDCSATWTPYVTLVTTLPSVVVVVYVIVAVVVAVQAVHVVHGASVLHAPLVQPDQFESGHPSWPHHVVHGPVVHEPEEPHGPHSPPKGPFPSQNWHPLGPSLMGIPPGHVQAVVDGGWLVESAMGKELQPPF